MKQLLLSLILLLAAGGVADAQEHTVRALVRDCSTGSSCQVFRGYGWATCVGQDDRTGDWILVTAGHAIRNAQSVDIGVREGDQHVWRPAKVHAWYVDHRNGWDIGVLRYSSQTPMTFRAIAESVPAEGSAVTFASKRSQVRRRGPGYVEIDPISNNGDSGSSLVFRGLVIGIVVGNVPAAEGLPAATVCTRCDRVRAYLAHVGIKLRQAPIAPLPPAAPSQDAPSSGHDARPPGAGCGCRDCECKALSAKFRALSDQFAALSADRDRLSGELEKVKAGFAVVFQAGDDSDEPERRIQIRPGETLSLPPAELHFRNVDEAGNQIGEVFTDRAPLGQPLMLRYVRSEKD